MTIDRTKISLDVYLRRLKMSENKVFITVNALVNGQKRVVDLVVSKIFGVSYSDAVKSTFILSDTGHAIPCEESPEVIKELIEKTLGPRLCG
jgi:hypothetical protein